MAPPRRPPELCDDAIAEILLRVPPDEPAHLVRAALVCKLWRRIVSGHAFLRRYRSFHRAPPLLGFFYNRPHPELRDLVSRFVPTSAVSAVPLPAFNCHDLRTLCCRHGRVLFGRRRSKILVVWDPITGDREELRMPDFPFVFYSAAVICAAAGCDHHRCHGTPFLVVFVGYNALEGAACACVYTSEGGAWGAPISLHVDVDYYIGTTGGTLVGDDIYFLLNADYYIGTTGGTTILKYDLGKHYLSVIKPPDMCNNGIALMPTEDGLLGLARFTGSRLCLWSRNANAENIEEWVQGRVIELEKLTPSDKFSMLIGFAEGLDVMFVGADDGAFALELKSGRMRKVIEQGISHSLFPFISFYTPDCTSGKWSLSAEAH